MQPIATTTIITPQYAIIQNCDQPPPYQSINQPVNYPPIQIMTQLTPQPMYHNYYHRRINQCEIS